MIQNTPATHEILRQLWKVRDDLLLPYVETPLTRPAFFQVRLRFFAAVKARFPNSDFDGWLKLEVVREQPAVIDVKLQHERMMEARDDVPDWVYFVLWTFNPGWAPTPKKENNEIRDK